MGDLSENFSRSEFACKCGCGFDTVDSELIDILQVFRTTSMMPVTINSGCRCPAYNATVGGALNSQHTLGRAADIVAGASPRVVQTYFRDQHPDKYGNGIYETFTHIDTRTGKARW